MLKFSIMKGLDQQLVVAFIDNIDFML